MLEFLKILIRTGNFFSLALNIVFDNCDGLVQDCSNSIANAQELLQSCTKPLEWSYNKHERKWQRNWNSDFLQVNQLGLLLLT